MFSFSANTYALIQNWYIVSLKCCSLRIICTSYTEACTDAQNVEDDKNTRTYHAIFGP